MQQAVIMTNPANSPVILIAAFPPLEGPAPRHAARLLHALIEGGSNPQTFATHPHSLAAYALVPGTRNFLRHLSPDLLRTGPAILYSAALPAFWHHPLHTTRLLWHLARHCQDLHLVTGPQPARALGLLLRLARIRHIKAVPLTRAASGLAACITGHRAAEITPQDADDFALIHAIAAHPQGVRLSPGLLRRTMVLPPGPAARDLCLLMETAALPGLAPCIRDLLHQAAQASRPAQIAAQPDPQIPALTRLATHLHAALKKETRLPLTNPARIEAFRRWLARLPDSPILDNAKAPCPRFDPSTASGAIARSLLDHFETGTPAPGLAAPAAPDAALSRLELLLALLTRAPVTALQALRQPWHDAQLRHWLVQTSLLSAIPAAPGLEITGLARSATGIGQNFWMSVAALTLARIPLTLIQTGDGPFTLAPLESVTPLPNPPTRHLLRPAALHHLNADRIPQILTHRRYATKPAMVHIGFLLWEFDALPKAHHLALEMLDEIWVPSAFLNRTYSRAAKCPVITIGKAIEIPAPAPFDRAHLGLTASDTMFLTAFDANSSAERKNPLAAARAFRAAFPKSGGHRLVIKSTAPVKNHWGDPNRQMQAVRALARRDPRIILIEADWSFPRLLGLIAAADALISPHRAEGFGYLAAYAMKLGTPVIASDYSGTQEYLSHETGWPVPCQLVPVQDGQSIFPVPGALWAEIDPSGLIDILRKVAGDRLEAACRAANGKVLIATRFSRGAQSTRYGSRLETLGIIAAEPAILAQPFDQRIA